MKRGKSFLAILVIVGIIIISTIYISAENLTGELNSLPAKVNVSVIASNNPPVITFVNNVTFFSINSVGHTNSYTTQPIMNNVASIQTNFSVYFTAYDDSGASQLPSTPDVTSNVLANLSFGTDVRNAVRCTYLNNIDTFRNNYSCNFSVFWSDESSLAGSWIMRFQIKSTGTTPIWSAVNGTQTLQYSPTYSVTYNPAGVNWTTNQIVANSPSLTTLSDNNISISNNGNVALDGGAYKFEINATKLFAEGGSGTFGATNFTAKQGINVADICGATAFSEALYTPVTVNVLTDISPPARNTPSQLSFCVKSSNGVVAQSYSTSAVGGNQWILNDCTGGGC